MGASISRHNDLSANEYLQKFVGKDPISLNDPFWNRFLAFNIDPPVTSNEQLALESRLEGLCQKLLKNNGSSANLGTIIDIFNIRSSELLAATNTDADLFNWQLFNTLFVTRCVLKFLAETVSEEQLLENIEWQGNGSRLENLIGSLVGIIVDVPIKDSTYAIHLEAVTSILVFLSVQLHSNKRSDHSKIYMHVMKGRHVIHAPLLVKSLLTNFIEQQKAPAMYGGSQGHSIVLGLAAELWSMLTFNRKSSEELVVLEQGDFQQAPLGTQSLLLILVLAHHWTSQSNPYRLSLFSCVNSQDKTPIPPSSHPTLFKINFDSLYRTLCKKAAGDAVTLMLYLLLHQNQTFKIYLLKRTDLDLLVIPILKTLYSAPNSDSHHIYMSLIILLILSEDDSFNKNIHETTLKNITWYSERALTEVSLGGLLVLVVIRTIQYNMLKMRDKYLHTNCLAALANMSAQFRDLHPYVSQRLVSLFETLAKRYQRLVQKIQNQKDEKENEVTITVNQDSDMEQDLGVLEEVLRMVLEILNSCLTHQLSNNPNLVYTLLYKKHVFEQFKNNVVFQDIIYNINIILKYFSELLSEKSQQYEVDATQVLHVIQQGAKHWPKEKLTKFPDLKFKYVEEDQPEEFFIPYVWALVSQQSVLHWTNDSTPGLTTVC